MTNARKDRIVLLPKEVEVLRELSLCFTRSQHVHEEQTTGTQASGISLLLWEWRDSIDCTSESPRP